MCNKSKRLVRKRTRGGLELGEWTIQRMNVWMKSDTAWDETEASSINQTPYRLRRLRRRTSSFGHHYFHSRPPHCHHNTLKVTRCYTVFLFIKESFFGLKITKFTISQMVRLRCSRSNCFTTCSSPGREWLITFVFLLTILSNPNCLHII